MAWEGLIFFNIPCCSATFHVHENIFWCL